MNFLGFRPASSRISFRSSALSERYDFCKDIFALKRLTEGSECSLRKSVKFGSFKSLVFCFNRFSGWGGARTGLCSSNESLGESPSAQLNEWSGNDGIRENDELELRDKPAFDPEDDDEFAETDDADVLEPFLKFFKQSEESGDVEDSGVGENNAEEGGEKITIEYYEPKPGDFVVGVVVSGNENKLDVNVGADMLGTMLTKDVLPLYTKDMNYLLCDLDSDAEKFLVTGKMGIAKNDDALSGEGKGPGRPVVETGTVLFAQVLGRTLSGRPLLSSRSYFRRIAWHRVRQIKQLNEPIEVKITEWNTGGLLTRIEGLRAFLPKAELVNRVNTFTELKENVGRKLHVLIRRINEENNDLILSEKTAWELLYLREGTLLEGTVVKIFPYGAQIRLGKTNRSGLLHISKISRSKVTSVSDILKVDEKLKVLVIKSLFDDKIALSVADLESEAGLFLSDREKVFTEAEEMARKYRERLHTRPPSLKSEELEKGVVSLDNEEFLYANWRWFKFETNEQSDSC